MRKIIASCVIFGICAGLFISQNQREYADFKVDSTTSAINAKSTSKAQQTIPFKPPTNSMLPNNENSAHSSSITDLGERLLVAYFAGNREGASDVKIMAQFVDKSTLRPTLPRAILSAQSLSKLTGKFIKNLGNPLVFKDANGIVHFFVVGVSLGGWATSKIYHLQLSDDLDTLTLRQELRLGLLGNFSHLIRTPPLMLENGGFMLPLYHELARKYPLVAFFDKDGNFSHTLRLNHLKNQLQPTIIALNERDCLAFFRNHKAYNNASFLQKCTRGGAIWESPNATNLKGFDDSYLLLNYKNAEGKSRILLLYNDGKVAESSNSRRSLGLYYLADSTKVAESGLDSTFSKHKINSSIVDEFLGLLEVSDDDRTQGSSRKRAEALPKKSPQDEFIFLQNIDIVDESYPNEVSYPSAVIDESALFVGYTYNRKAIKLRKINLVEIEREIAESTLFGGLESRELKMDSSFCESKKKQKLLKDLCEAPENSPASWCKKSGEASSSASADFLLEADKRGSPPKSEKAAAFWRVGGAGRGVQPFLREKTSKNNGNEIVESSTQNAESSLDSAVDCNADSANLLAMTENRDSSPTAQNDNFKKNAESTINYDIFGIYLLFLSAFFFVTNPLSKRTKYFALPCFVALISIPFIFVLWDYYSIVNLFYSLFGGVSVFCALLCIRYIAIRLLRNLCGSLKNPRLMDLMSYLRADFPAQPTNLAQDTRIASASKISARFCVPQNLAPLIALFSIPLFLGHLDLINFDILRSEIFSAIFASAFIVALFWVDRVAFVLALIAVVIDRDFIFALFDGYLLIFSVIYCAIWAVKSAFKRIIARA